MINCACASRLACLAILPFYDLTGLRLSYLCTYSHHFLCGIKAGIIKVVTGHPVIIEEEHELLLAAARASVAIGAYKNWVPTNFFQRVIPMLRFGGATDAQLETMLTENPRRFFEGEAPR